MLIITGLLGESLRSINDALRDAGAGAPREIPYAVLPTVQAWLDRFMSQVAPEDRLNPGRMWEIAAGELMLANVAQSCWTWADQRHLELLDFWCNLDPSARFLLLQVDPARYLAEFCRAHGDTAGMKPALQQWEAATSRMLSFHLRHRENSAMTFLHAWQANPPLALRDLAALASPAPEASYSPLPETDPELLWLCEQWLKACPRAQQLWLEVEAHCPSSPKPPHDLIGGDHSSSLDSAIRSCIERLTALDQQARLLTSSSLAREESARQVAAATEALIHMRERAEAAEAAQFSSVPRDAEMALASRDAEVATVTRALSDAQTEARWLREQLHQVQEELEHTYLLHHALHDECAALRAARRRMLSRYPATLDFHRAEMIHRTAGTLAFRFFQLALGNQVVPVFEVLLVASSDGGALIIPSGQVDVPWTGAKNAAPLVISSDQAPGAPPAEPRLTALSCTQWRLIRAMPSVMRLCLTEENMVKMPWETALSALETRLRAPEHLWRWDAVALLNEQVNADYEHLWIRLEAASFDGQHWPQLDFRISAAEVCARQFSGHFKYEIPTQSDGPQLFEHWQPDVTDEWGERFELRINLAEGALDAAAWSRLSHMDRQRLVGLMVQLSEMISALDSGGISISRPWADWLELNLQAIRLLLRLAGASTDDDHA